MMEPTDVKMSAKESDEAVSNLLSPPVGEDGKPTYYTREEREELFSIDPGRLEDMQLAGVQKRFAELSPALPTLGRLAEENRITSIEEIDELVPLLFPHTNYKSYPMSLIDNARFEQLNGWLDDFTIHDLSDLDVTGCESLDEWLDVVEANTPVRVMASSGTSGKISLIPKSALEESRLLPGWSTAYMEFRDEPGLSDFRDPDLYHVFPFARRSRHSTGMIIRNAIESYDGDESHVLSLGGEMSADLLWMTGRMKKAQADGTVERLKKTKAWRRLDSKLAELEAGRAGSLDEFFEDMVVRLKDKKVFLVMGLNYFWTMIECAERNGLEIRFAPGSVVTAAGGSKWDVLTDAQKAKVWETVPFPNAEAYGFSEILNGVGRKCREGYYHPPPWVVQYVLDPDTGAPFPRTGTQTGRGAAFDLWAETYWGGFISSDEVTVNWDGACPCGRTGPCIHDDVIRYTDKHGGDDKITCQRTASAVDEAMEHIDANR